VAKVKESIRTHQPVRARKSSESQKVSFWSTRPLYLREAFILRTLREECWTALLKRTRFAFTASWMVRWYLGHNPGRVRSYRPRSIMQDQYSTCASTLPCCILCRSSRGAELMTEGRLGLPQGTLDLLILKALRWSRCTVGQSRSGCNRSPTRP
jgi:hypothetical protein